MIEVTIYGPKSSSFEYVKLMLKELLEDSSIEMHVESNHNVDDFIKLGIESVPAVQVNQDMFFEKTESDHINGFIRKVVQSILKVENYGKMKKIVVPIDFSESSVNAFYYAKQLAEDFGSVLKVAHIYHPNPVDIQGQVFIDSELEKVQRKRLSKFVESVNQDWIGDLSTSSLVDEEFIIGFPVPEIVKLSQLPETEFVVMGNKGDDNAFRKLFGSVSSDIARRSYSPVFIIPPEISFEPFKEIVYATNDQSLDALCLDLVVKLAQKYEATIHIVHVKEDDKNFNNNDLLKLMKEHYPNANLKCEVVHQASVLAGITQYIEKTQANLLVLATKRRNFWSRLMHKSTTQAMAITTELPLLVFHEGDEF